MRRHRAVVPLVLSACVVAASDEMLSVFHLEGDRLILQHYCSAGSQPRLELVRADSSGLFFDLTGGTGFDPGTDGHIHSARFIIGPDRVESYWTWFDGGRSDHTPPTGSFTACAEPSRRGRATA